MLEEIRRKARNDFELWSTLTRVLGFTSIYSKYRKIDTVREVPVNSVLISVWVKHRYESLSKTNIEDVVRKHPPVLTGYKLIDGETIYVPVDGNHRVAVAEDRGLKTIPARVITIYEPVSGTLLFDGINIWIQETKEMYKLGLTLNDNELRYLQEIMWILEKRGFRVFDYTYG